MNEANSLRILRTLAKYLEREICITSSKLEIRDAFENNKAWLREQGMV